MLVPQEALEAAERRRADAEQRLAQIMVPPFSSLSSSFSSLNSLFSGLYLPTAMEPEAMLSLRLERSPPLPRDVPYLLLLAFGVLEAQLSRCHLQRRSATRNEAVAVFMERVMGVREHSELVAVFSRWRAVVSMGRMEQYLAHSAAKAQAHLALVSGPCTTGNASRGSRRGSCVCV